MMKIAGFLLVVVCALGAQGAPTLSESFNATLLVQYIGGNAMSTYVRDASGAGREYWSLLSEPENIYAGQVLDYNNKRSYNLLQFGPLYGCLPLAINGTLPKMWDWLSSAVDGGKADYMNSVVEVWAGNDSAGNYREVGVSSSDPNRPVYTVISTHRTSVQFTWLEYNPNASGADFSTPLECGSGKSSAMPGMMGLFNLGLANPIALHP